MERASCLIRLADAILRRLRSGEIQEVEFFAVFGLHLRVQFAAQLPFAREALPEALIGIELFEQPLRAALRWRQIRMGIHSEMLKRYSDFAELLAREREVAKPRFVRGGATTSHLSAKVFLTARAKEIEEKGQRGGANLRLQQRRARNEKISPLRRAKLP